MSRSDRPRPAPRQRLRGLAALLALSPALPGAALAEFYRYLDENGVVVYSQTPPPAASAEALRMDPGPAPAETDAALKRLREQIEQDFDARGDEVRAAEAEATQATAAAKRAEGCAAARKNMQTLENLGARMLRMPDGTLRRPGEQERRQMMDDTRARIGELCD